MGLIKEDIIDYGEYKVHIRYYGDGEISVVVLDELDEEIEGIYITNSEDDDDNFLEDFNLN